MNTPRMTTALGITTALVVSGALALAGCSNTNNATVNGQAAAGAGTKDVQIKVPWPLTPVQKACDSNAANAPVNGQPIPANFPLPNKVNQGVTTAGSVTGVSSFFGGPYGGANGAFGLTFQYGAQPPTPDQSVGGGMYPEFGGTDTGWNPCDNFFAAMNFANTPDKSPVGPTYPAYESFGDGTPDLTSRYVKPFLLSPPDYSGPYIASRTPLYNRKLLVCVAAGDCSQGVVVRAVDNGPADPTRVIDLSPGASGTLAAISQIAPSGAFAPLDCINWDGGNDQPVTTAANCQFDDRFVTPVKVQWANPASTIGPCGTITVTPPTTKVPVTQVFPACNQARKRK